MSINREKLVRIRRDLEAALELVAKEHGITFGIGKMKFGADSFKVELVAFEDCGDGQSVKEIEFRKYAPGFGLAADNFGKKITLGPDTFTISGIARKSYKYPVLADKDGTTYKLPVADVLAALS